MEGSVSCRCSALYKRPQKKHQRELFEPIFSPRASGDISLLKPRTTTSEPKPLLHLQSKEKAKMFPENPHGFRSGRWGNDETDRNRGGITCFCHCYSFHATVMSQSKEKRKVPFFKKKTKHFGDILSSCCCCAFVYFLINQTFQYCE